MTKEVLLSISGIQFDNNEDEPIKVITAGEYFFEDDIHYINYEEVSEDKPKEVTKCTIKIKNNGLEMIKNGPMSVHMIFEEGRKHVSYYNTPYGDLVVGTYTNRVRMSRQEDAMEITISYGLEINGQHISNSEIVVNVQSKEKADLKL
ncbi:Uncharacterized beta-barrel protein YwiB, DUF1934 family [Parasporobacterium paucivorans DSM 15970]|uniref:Uncharacterized beta-barrel protein YwiB, DUF1934 family n=1 Tax=Parasporobacterium paucivorans DSM 15970 TaxID=1122934 RepID=A0A1M6BEP1_9FIRM|nr:Uncharacterized beta-barrel protein YwiB, DUF1934 family [Parasporobacterium paucivorans DSM 15970]